MPLQTKQAFSLVYRLYEKNSARCSPLRLCLNASATLALATGRRNQMGHLKHVRQRPLCPIFREIVL